MADPIADPQNAPSTTPHIFRNFAFPSNQVAVTPSDDTDLAHSGGLMIEGTGTIKYMTDGGQIITRTLTLDETFIPFVVKRVYATGTSVSTIWVCY